MRDVQNEKENRGISLQCVGVCDYKIPIMISGQHTIGITKFGVSLDESHKGIHMSRLCSLLNGFTEIDNLSIENLLIEACKVMDSDSSQMQLKTSIYLEKKAPVSGSTSKLFYDIVIDAQKEKDRIDVLHTLIIPITTLCPCSKAISEYGAHNQRGIVKITLQNIEVQEYESIIKRIEECVASSELFGILKRTDEKSVTERAYDNPKFVEDVVRDAIVCLNDKYEKKLVSVAAVSYESIHNHNAFACKSVSGVIIKG